MRSIKSILKIIFAMLSVVAVTSCSGDGSDLISTENVKMKATVVEISDKIAVEVIEGEYGASGPYLVIFSEKTPVYGVDGNGITVSDIKVGDTLEITYGGQVMMSYPPQIAAKSIRVVSGQ